MGNDNTLYVVHEWDYELFSGTGVFSLTKGPYDIRSITQCPDGDLWTIVKSTHVACIYDENFNC